MDVQLTDVAFGGEALGHLPDGRVVFVPRSLPGETARVRLQEDRRDYARAELEALLSSAPGRVEAPCPYYHAGCGGCSWQHADYPLQLRVKHAVVVDQLRRIGHFAEPESFVRPTLGMLNPWHYRNQARFTVGRKFGELCFTFRSSHRLLRIDHCWIVHPAINEALAQLQSKLSVVPGRVHQVSIRVGANTGQALVAPALPGIGQIETGQPWLEEELLGARFRLRPTSFFQVNTLRERSDLGDSSLAAGDQFEARTGHRALLPVPPDGLSMAEILALLVLDRLRPSASDVIVDAYSGVGTFAVLLAPLVKHVIAIEEARAAVQDARHNARHLSNVTLIEAKTEAALPALDSVVPALAARPTAVILDPARVGAHPAVLDALLAQRPERLVYVSCDPTTLARDLRVLVDGGYTLTDVLPIDMFPQTYHIESVATLIR
jgi:23S rRNA (uracil1939-C5)-methyltransferase